MHQRDAEMHMGRITFTADAHHEDIIADVQGEDGVESQSEAVRECISRYADLQQRDEELQQQVADLQQEVERLRNEKRTLIAQREENQELVRFVEDEMERREQRDTAPIWTRARWWVLGREADG